MNQKGKNNQKIIAYLMVLLLLINFVPIKTVQANTKQSENYTVEQNVSDGEAEKQVENLKEESAVGQGLKQETGNNYVISGEKTDSKSVVREEKADSKAVIREERAEVKLSITEGEGTEFGFEELSPEITYGEGVTYQQVPQGAGGENVEVTYTIASAEGEENIAAVDAKTGVVTPLKAGKVIVTAACRDLSGNAADKTAKYELTIHKGNEIQFEKKTENGEPLVIYYGQAFANAIIKDAGNVSYTVEPSTDGVTVDGSGNISYEEATAEVAGKLYTVRAVRAEDACYNAAFAEYQFIIQYPQITFETEYPEITYGEVYRQLPVVEASDLEYDVTYEVLTEEGKQIAGIDKEGWVTAKKAGTVTVCATCKTKKGNVLGKKTYELKIHKAVRKLEFEKGEEGETIVVYYGQAYSNRVMNVPGDGDVIYSVASADAKGIHVENDGTVNYQQVTDEAVVIRAVKPADDCYEESTAEYQLKIAYAEPPAGITYKLDGTEGKNGWYTSDVSLEAVQQDGTPLEDYYISAENDKDKFGNAGSLTLREEKEYENYTFYLRDKYEQGITDGITVKESIKIDKTAPAQNAEDMKIVYSKAPVASYENEYKTEANSKPVDYYDKQIQVTLMVKQEEQNGSGIASLRYSWKEDGEDTVVPVQKCSVEDGMVTYSFTCPAVYRYKIAFSAEDYAGNVSRRLADGTIVVDDKKSEISVKYQKAEPVTDSNTLETIAVDTYEYHSSKNVNLYYTGESAKVLTYQITEDFFYPEDVRFSLYVNGALAEDYTKYAFLGDADQEAGEGKWRKNGEKTWEIDLVLQEGGDYVAELSYEDRSKNGEVSIDKTEHIYVDNTSPVVLVNYSQSVAKRGDITYYKGKTDAVITVLEKNFRASDIELQISAKDTNGKKVDIYCLDAQGEKQSFEAYAKNQANWQQTDGKQTLNLVFDTDAEYNFDISYKDLANHAAVYGADKSDAYLADHFVVDNMAMKKAVQSYEEMYAQNYTRLVDKNNQQIITPQEATEESRFVYAGEAEAAFLFEEANFYPEDAVVSVSRDGNVCQVENDGYQLIGWSEEEKEDKNLHKLTVKLGVGNENGSKDGNYQIKINYTDCSGNVMTEYSSNIVTIDTTVPVFEVKYDNTEANRKCFYKEKRIATLQVKDRNILPEEMQVKVNASDIMGNEVAVSGKLSQWKNSGDEKEIWTCTYTYDVDANYQFEITCVDMAEHKITSSDSFTVDRKKPAADDITITYSTSLLQKIISGVTFGYYRPKVTVTVTAEDTTAGVDYLEWSYQKQKESSSSNVDEESGTIKQEDITYSQDKKTATAKFTLKAAKDRQYAGYLKVRATDNAGNTGNYRTDKGTEIVVDTISPTRTVTYSPAVQVINKTTGNTLDDFTVTSEDRNVQLYYDAAMTVTFDVTEANFYPEDAIIKVNGEKKKVTWKKAEEKKDIWRGTVKLEKEGDYIVTMEYTDRSGNKTISDTTKKTGSYKSGVITIDKEIPALSVTYVPAAPVGIIEEMNYYNGEVSSVITIKEHNFRASDVEAVVTAGNISGENVEVSNYSQYLKDVQNWTTEGDIHTATISYPADANYTLQIAYKDLAGHEAAAYGKDAFTVDKNKPENLSVEYSASIFQTVLEAITFGFYQAQMTVTLKAEDATAGIHQFTYSYLKSPGVSDVNTELVNGVIAEDEIEFSNGGRTATARFSIPSAALRGDNQFNGTVEFAAIDRCGWKEELKDNTRIVVDNIAPAADIQYNEPVQKTDGVSYYNGEITAHIDVTEANFYEEDVEVSIVKDGSAATAADVSWTDNSADQHVGTFTLTEDGDYIVMVNYTDRSNNTMEEYQSEQLTIDTSQPQLTVRGIKNHSANNAETIGFVVTVEDVNFDPAAFTPQLKAELWEKDGSIHTQDMTEYGTISTVTVGSQYTYTVTNLDKDGVYTLTCPVADMAENQADGIQVVDSGNQMVNQVVFSVNRKGSTYLLDDATKEINGTFAKDEIDAVITEINVDEISNNKVTLFKNEETKTLEKDKDYILKKTGDEESWHTCTYTVLKDNFKEDGVYRLALYSEDAAGNVAENTLDTKKVEISFGIDKTEPNLIVANLESGATYPVPELQVLMQATDNMGLESVAVWLDDMEGAPYQTWEKDAVGSNADFDFTIAGTDTHAHNVEIVLTDIAGNQTREKITDFYVTTDKWVRFYRNKPLVAGTAAGATVVVVGTTGIVIFRRRRKLLRLKNK